MKAYFLFLLVTAFPTSAIANAQSVGYVIGFFIAMAILGYLVYSLFKPDKF